MDGTTLIPISSLSDLHVFILIGDDVSAQTVTVIYRGAEDSHEAMQVTERP
jgi:hypothetical protein